MKNCRIACIFVILLGFASAAVAGSIQFKFNFSSPFNAAQANGIITLDSNLLTNPPPSGPFGPPKLQDLTVVVTGSATGNGTFTLADFDAAIFSSVTALDFSRELVGQPTANGPWGTGITVNPNCGQDFVKSPGSGGKANLVITSNDFNLFRKLPGHDQAPDGVDPFTLEAGGLGGECMALTSLKPVAPVQVPALDGWSLAALIALLGLAGLATSGRRRRA